MGRMSDRAIELQEHAEYSAGRGARNVEEVIAYVRIFMRDFSIGDEKFIRNLTLEYFGEGDPMKQCQNILERE